ncbi:hypothetical protein GGR55DRAFT_426316 [Xylaria sp. FL0064]|nr:hypothetical protein GGR55DRAFT_426316 [Xylaria sp. FL0064]
MYQNQPYSRPFEGSHNDVPRRNPNYKGKNYDPNYQDNRRNNSGKKRNNKKVRFEDDCVAEQTYHQQNSSSGPPRRAPRINPHLQSHQIQLQTPDQQHFIPYEQLYQAPVQQHFTSPEQLLQQYPEPQPQVTPPDNLAVYLLDGLAQTVDERIRKDREGDTKICGCIADGTPCLHAIVDLCQDLLEDCGMLQHGIVDLLCFLMSKNGVLNESIKDGLLEYLQNNPQTPISTILDLMGQY